MQLPRAIEKLYITLCPNHFIPSPGKLPCILSSAVFFQNQPLKNLSDIPSRCQNRMDPDQA